MPNDEASTIVPLDTIVTDVATIVESLKKTEVYGDAKGAPVPAPAPSTLPAD